MSDINYDALERSAVRILTLHQAAIMKLGVGEIAWERKKSDKTVYAELNPSNLITYIETIRKYDDGEKKPGCLPKLGLIDFMIDLIRTQDFSPLVALNEFFSMVCFPVPGKIVNPEKAAAGLANITQAATKECTESFNAVIRAMAGDGRVSKVEAKKVSREAMDAINALAELKAIADALVIGIV